MSLIKTAATALAFSLALAGCASAQWGYGGGYGGGYGRGYDRGHHDGWRHHHRGPRCWTERIVHYTPWGPRVDYRRVCR